MRSAISILALIIVAYAPNSYALELCEDLMEMQDFLKTSEFIEQQTERIEGGGSYGQLAVLYLKRGIARGQVLDNKEALDDCSKAIQLDPGYADAYNARGCIHAGDKDHKEAIQDFTAVLNLVKDPNVYINRGGSYTAKGEYDQAIADYTEAIAINRESAVAYNERGRAYLGKGDREKATADYTAAIKIDPQYIDAYRNRGSLFQQQQDYDQAIADFSKAIRLSSNDLSSYFITIDRGNAYMMKEDFDKAIADYSEAIRVKSDYVYAYDRRGLAYFVKGDYNRALADYSKVITNDPKSAYVYLAQVRKGDIYRARLNHERALDEYTQAARSNSERMEAYYGRGSVYYSRGDYDRATADYNEAIKIAPQFEHSYVHLVNVSRKLSAEDYQASLKKLRDYVNNSSSAEWIRTASKYYLGVADITEEAVLNDAKKGKNALVRRINLCEAYYFLGEVRLGKGDRIGARKLFNKSVETKSYLSGEFHISQALLKRMAEGKY